MVEQHAEVDDFLIQLALRRRGDRRDRATEALAALAMHLGGVDRFSVGLDDASGKLGLLSARLVAVRHEDGVVDDRDRRRPVSQTEAQDLAPFITTQLAKAVE